MTAESDSFLSHSRPFQRIALRWLKSDEAAIHSPRLRHALDFTEFPNRHCVTGGCGPPARTSSRRYGFADAESATGIARTAGAEELLSACRNQRNDDSISGRP